MPTRDEVFATVRETLVDALGVDDDEVTPTATLMGDLGAESPSRILVRPQPTIDAREQRR